jgi:chaperonin GroES
MQLHPLADRIVAKSLEAETKTHAGILIAETAKEKPVVAEVTAIGADVTIKVGDHILYSGKYDSSKEEVKLDADTYIILKEADVLAVVKG